MFCRFIIPFCFFFPILLTAQSTRTNAEWMSRYKNASLSDSSRLEGAWELQVVKNRPDSAVQEKALLEQKVVVKIQTAKAQAARNNLILIVIVIIVLLHVLMINNFYKHNRKQEKNARQLANINSALEKTNQELSQTNQKMDRFSSIIAHDILTNLDLILSYGNVLVGSKPKKEDAIQYYHTTQQICRHLKTYCLQLLEEARNKNEMSQKTVNPNKILQEVVNLFQNSIKLSNIKMEIGKFSSISLPPALIEQLFQNLISNAIKYGCSNPLPCIRVYEMQMEHGSMQWVVEDNGPGVNGNLFDTLPLPNLSGKPDSGRQVGLRLLQTNLLHYGATIETVPSWTNGTKFVIHFPLSVSSVSNN